MVASEFFTADLPCVAEIIFQDPDLMRYLFSFVQADQTLNFLLAGYFLKAYESCLNSNPEEFFMIIYQESYHIAILKHLKSSSISEIVFSILTSKSSLEERKLVLDQVIRLLGSYDYFVSFNASSILSRISKDEEIFQFLIQKPAIDALFEFFKKDEVWVIRNAGTVLKYVLNGSGDSIALHLKDKISCLANILKRDPEVTIPTTFGLNIKPFGEDRLTALELLSVLLNFPIVFEEIAENVSVVVNLFSEYK